MRRIRGTAGSKIYPHDRPDLEEGEEECRREPCHLLKPINIEDLVRK
jgi:hypothetical protein